MKCSHRQEPEPELDYWQHAWKQVMTDCSYAKQKGKNDQDATAFWDKLAAGYDRRTNDPHNDTVDRIISWLEREKIIGQQSDILDVGCGTGAYAIPFARRVRSVTGIDGSPNMGAILKKKAIHARLENITVMSRLWEAVDLKKEGLDHAFDLVFASLTPAVWNTETLMKLNQASKNACCLISWAGSPHSRARFELGRMVEKHENNGRAWDIIYPFNILYGSGYYPTLTYFDWRSTHRVPTREAIQNLTAYFSFHGADDPAVADTIVRYVNKNAVDGTFIDETRMHLGVMVWNHRARSH